jgi:hypothetical protein
MYPARGELLKPVQHLRIAALCLNHIFEFLVAGTIQQFLLRQFARFIQRGSDFPQEDHARGQFQRNARQIRRPRILQCLRNFHHFQRVAYRVTQRLVHIRDQGLYALVHAAADAHHHLRQASRIHLPLHESARAHFHIQHHRVQSHRQLLRHDGRCNQCDGFHRRRGIP